LRCGAIPGTNLLTPDSIQEALQMYLQPIKNDDPQLDFYTMYKRETMYFDTKYMQKYNKDLNNTLIFVRFCGPFIDARLDRTLRLVCSLQSALPLSSISSPNLSWILVNGPKPTSEQSFSPSTDLSSLMKTPLLPQHGRLPPQKSSRPWTFCTQVC